LANRGQGATAVEDLADVRRRARAWFEENWDPELTLGDWWRRLADSGWGQPHWPVGRYGHGLSTDGAAVVFEERHRVGALGPPSGIASNLTAPTLFAYGTEAQLDRFLPGIVSGEHIWCQLFSEPSAGSDLASLRTRAERDGEQWVVNGQKVWTSGAHKARYGLLIARTDPSAPKHRGISFFVIDMHQPGVEVRPLREMTGRAVFNEVFLTDARVPAENLVGGLHDGWRVTNTTLNNERNGLGAIASRGGGRLDVHDQDLGMRIADLFAAARAREASERERAAAGGAATARGHHLLAALLGEVGRRHEPVMEDLLARNTVAGEVNRLSALRIRSLAEAARLRGEKTGPSPLVSVQKLAVSQNLHALGRALLTAEGAHGMLAGPDALIEDRAMETLATGYMISIGGGTDQIQRNIIGERVLGLPGEPKVDRDVPFDQLPRS
jgi:alkylation response protein AidB-like acyl-CoA dehydrogenase